MNRFTSSGQFQHNSYQKDNNMTISDAEKIEADDQFGFASAIMYPGFYSTNRVGKTQKWIWGIILNLLLFFGIVEFVMLMLYEKSDNQFEKEISGVKQGFCVNELTGLTAEGAIGSGVVSTAYGVAIQWQARFVSIMLMFALGSTLLAAIFPFLVQLKVSWASLETHAALHVFQIFLSWFLFLKGYFFHSRLAWSDSVPLDVESHYGSGAKYFFVWLVMVNAGACLKIAFMVFHLTVSMFLGSRRNEPFHPVGMQGPGVQSSSARKGPGMRSVNMVR